ncbi:cytidylyltransferase [Klosneuvirus KNV1]|uniref:Cytidylyltransferase n=1 Tax=Klosneuvirus KNV1 TaxID=1977640 RepID=A0A1V0SKZ8_9VIRU|nr:cytidylyltransferase [Klosneuvirus KNV1]
MFLNKVGLENLSRWKYSVEDKSITTEWLTPLWKYLTDLMPKTVAPNVISFVGLLCTILSYYYLDTTSGPMLLLSASLIFIYQNLDAIDGMHARKTRNGSPLGELVDHACDNITAVFLILGATVVLDITDPYKQWMIVQTGLLIFMLSHIEAFQRGVVQFGRYSGPGEVLFVNIFIILLRILTNFSWIDKLVISISKYATMLPSVAYLVVLAYTIYRVVGLKNHYETRNGLLIALMIRFISSMIYLNMSIIDTYTVISHGLVMTILASDLIVSKMAKRELHPLVPVFMMISIPHNILCIALCLVYHVTVLCEISFGLNIPLINVRCNVFCNGVYDLTHLGHMKLFERAASYGNKLIVGVHNDEDVESYKRKPVMTHKERCDQVKMCRHVDQVVENCPLNLTKEFIMEHNIHVVVCSEEYDNPDDEYYKVAREMGILQVLPRTNYISTSELIRRVQSMKKDESHQQEKVEIEPKKVVFFSQ